MLQNMTAPANYYNNPMYPGMQYQQIKRPSMTQPLTPEQMQLLSAKGGNFSTRVAQEDIFRSYCTHKKDGNIVLNNNGDGTFTCPICQETFAETDLDPQHVREIVTEMVNILQMIKTTYMDIPNATAMEFFPIITLLEKTPELAEIAMRNFSQYEQGGVKVQNASNPYSFGALSSLMGGPMAYPGMQPNMYQNPQMMYQQPYLNQPMVGDQQQYINQPMMGQQMAPAQVQVTPQQQFMPINEYGSYTPQQTQQLYQPIQPQVYQPNQQQAQPLYQPIQPQTQQPNQQVNQQANQQPASPVTVDTTAFTL